MRKVNEDINKLPKWARFKIQKLEDDMKHYQNKVLEIKGDKKTNVYIDRGMEEPQPLPNDSQIIFVVNKDRSIKCGQIEVRVLRNERNCIEVYGNEQLNIKCHASNICHITSRRD